MLKIVKHCKDSLPNLVSGALLGLDQKGVLEITHSFPGLLAASLGEGHSEEYYAERDQEYVGLAFTLLAPLGVPPF